MSDLIREVFDTLLERPNARVLVLEREPTDAVNLADHMRAAGMAAGHSARDKILVLAVGEYSQTKMRMGTVDIVFINNRYNVRRVDKHPKWRKVLIYINRMRHHVTFITRDVQLPTELAPMPTNTPWVCGEAIVLKCLPMELIAQEFYSEPCGGTNERRHLYCRHCGRFRGLEYNPPRI